MRYPAGIAGVTLMAVVATVVLGCRRQGAETPARKTGSSSVQPDAMRETASKDQSGPDASVVPSTADVPGARSGEVLPMLVIDSASLPVAGATVTFYDASGVDGIPIRQARAGGAGPWLRTVGVRLTADETGIVRVPGFAETAWIAAESGRRRGGPWAVERSGLGRESPRMHLPLYAENERVVVEVVDGAGRPVPDLTVELVGQVEPAEPDPIHVAIGPTDRTGRIEWSPLQFRAPLSDLERAWIRPRWPTTGPARVEFDPRRPPAPIRLRLAQSGALRVEIVDQHGTPWKEAAWVDLRASLDHVRRFDDPFDRTALALDGVAEFRGLPPGFRGDVTVRAADGSREEATTRVELPAEDGDPVRVVVEVGSLKPILVGTVVGPDGRAARRRRFDIEWWARKPDPEDPDQDTRGELDGIASSEEGRLFVPLDLELRAPVDVTIEVKPRAREGDDPEDTAARIEVPGVHAGPNDLGTIRLARMPVIASGRVVGSDGVGRCDVRVTLYAAEPGDEDDPVERAEVLTDADGWFTFRGLERDGVSLLVRAQPEEGPDERSPRFPPGARDLKLVLYRPASIELPVRLADPSLRPFIVAQFRGSAGWSGEPWRSGDRSRGFCFGAFDEKGILRFDGLRPGTGRIVLLHSHDWTDIIAEVPGIEVTEGAAITLDPLEIRQAFAPRRISVVRDDGGPLPEPLSVFATIDGNRLWPALSESGDIRLPPKGRIEDLFVAAPGYATVHLAEVLQPTTVCLRRAAPVRAELVLDPDGLPRGADRHWHLAVERQKPEKMILIPRHLDLGQRPLPEDGRIEVTFPEPGPWTFTLRVEAKVDGVWSWDPKGPCPGGRIDVPAEPAGRKLAVTLTAAQRAWVRALP